MDITYIPSCYELGLDLDRGIIMIVNPDEQIGVFYHFRTFQF